MIKLKISTIVAVLFACCLFFGEKVSAEEVEFTVSNYTHDYALRITDIELVYGTLKEDHISSERLNDGSTKALYITSTKGSFTDPKDLAGFTATFEVIGHPELCGDDQENCRFYALYEDTTTFTFGMGTIVKGLKHLNDNDNQTGYSNGITPLGNSPFVIKDAGCFTKRNHPWCKIHIEKK